MNEAAITALSIVVVAIIGGVVAVIQTLLTLGRKAPPATPPAVTADSPEPPADAEDSEVVAWLWAQMTPLLIREAERDRVIAEQGERIEQLVEVAHVAADLVEWIDGGAKPPAPVISEAVRRFISALRATPSPPP